MQMVLFEHSIEEELGVVDEFELFLDLAQSQVKVFEGLLIVQLEIVKEGDSQLAVHGYLRVQGFAELC